ncbi:MAG: CRISPR-associated endonuclease Cas1 [Desulfobacterales bacterium]
MTEAVYVLEPGSYLRREGLALKVVKEGETIDTIPADGLKRLMLIGHVSLSGAVLDYLIQHRVETVFLTPTGRFRARLMPDEHKHVALRRAQYLTLSNPERALAVAASIVRGKAENCVQMLIRRASDYQSPDLRTAAAQIRPLVLQAAKAQSLPELRGIEGAIARIYYAAFPTMIRNPLFPFHGRNRRPPLDPINALLSFAYTLVTNEVLSAVKAVGLDPYLGSLHEEEYGRPSLACDLAEEYRCFIADRLVLGIVNRRRINPEDFVYRGKPPAEFTDEEEMIQRRPVEMKPAVCRAFIASYEETMQRSIFYPPLSKKVNLRWLILNQVRRFAESLGRPEATYQPFLWEA